MQRRPGHPTRRFSSSGGFSGLLHPKSRASPLLSAVLLFLGAVFVIGYIFRGSGPSGSGTKAFTRIEGDSTCTFEVSRALLILKKAYGGSMRKVLHVGPESCTVVSNLLKEEKTEAWGVEPYDIEDADGSCKTLVRKGIVRVADIKFPLPYRAKSFSLVIVSDALDYLSPRYLNRTLLDLARVSSDGLVIFTGLPGQSRAKVAELSKFGRPFLPWLLPSNSRRLDICQLKSKIISINRTSDYFLAYLKLSVLVLSLADDYLMLGN